MANYLLQAMDSRPTVHNREGSMCNQLDRIDDLLGKLCWPVFVLQAPDCSLLLSVTNTLQITWSVPDPDKYLLDVSHNICVLSLVAVPWFKIFWQGKHCQTVGI